MKREITITDLEYITNNQAQGSNDLAFSINKQVEISTSSKTPISSQLQQDYVLLQRVIKFQQYNESKCSIYAAIEEVRLR